jgi:IS30 family transposase
VQLPNALLTVTRHRFGTENSRRILQQLALPRRHLVRVHLVMRRDLRDRLLASDRFQRHLRLELRGMITSWPSHGLPSGHARTEIPLYPCPKYRSQLYYRASEAEQAAWDQARRPKPCKLVQNRALARIVAQKLKELRSPEQIAGWLKYTYSDDENYQESHETIHRSLFIQARGALKKELLQYLRRSRVMRRSRSHTQKTDDHGRISNTISISERPPSVEDRAVPGHWEGDLIFGSNSSQIATLVERQTRYVMMAKVNSKDTETVINVLVKHAHQLPRELYESLAWDRAKEMADHKRFTLATDIKVYFCDPQNPWQRGTNENTNGLLRAVLFQRHGPIGSLAS